MFVSEKSVARGTNSSSAGLVIGLWDVEVRIAIGFKDLKWRKGAISSLPRIKGKKPHQYSIGSGLR